MYLNVSLLIKEGALAIDCIAHCWIIVDHGAVHYLLLFIVGFKRTIIHFV